MGGAVGHCRCRCGRGSGYLCACRGAVLQEVMIQSVADSSAPRGHTEFSVDGAEVGIDGAAAHDQPLPHLRLG
jgi:hypothetical protein